MIIDGELRKVITGSRHLLHQSGDAIALDLEAIRTAERQGISRVVVFDRETSTTYRTTITELYRRGWQFNKGWGYQIAMRREHWHVDGDQVQTIEPPAAKQPSVAARQLAFW